jgi:hypothetical protein
MTCFWWQLPGTRQFIDRVVQDLRDGKNVILSLPEHLPSGLSNAIQSELGDDCDWHKISVRDESLVEPIHFLFDCFVGEISPKEIRNARTLAQHPQFSGKIIWLDDVTVDIWPVWKKFILDYEQPCRAISPLYRTLFVVSLVGELAIAPPAENVCLSHHTWEGVVNSLDMLLFTASVFPSKRLSDLQKQVAISVITHLALWDFEVSERLVCEKIENILSPEPILLEIAQERGWYYDHTQKIPFQEIWCKGMKNTVEGEAKIHSSALALDSLAQGQIKGRIWKGEVGEVLPFIEERRQEIIERLSKVLKVPFKNSFGEIIRDLRDLEIGHIEYQLSQTDKIVNPEIRQLVKKLKEMRNSLSHLEPISQDILDCREINSWSRILKN